MMELYASRYKGKIVVLFQNLSWQFHFTQEFIGPNMHPNKKEMYMIYIASKGHMTLADLFLYQYLFKTKVKEYKGE